MDLTIYIREIRKVIPTEEKNEKGEQKYKDVLSHLDYLESEMKEYYLVYLMMRFIEMDSFVCIVTLKKYVDAAKFPFRDTTLNNMLYHAIQARNVGMCNLFKEWGAKCDADIFKVACCSDTVDVLGEVFENFAPTKEMLLGAIRDDLIQLNCMSTIRYLYEVINDRYNSSLPKFVGKVVALVIKHRCWEKFDEFAKYQSDEMLLRNLMNYKDEERIMLGIKRVVNETNLKLAAFMAGKKNRFLICKTLITGIDDEAGGESRRQMITNLCLSGATQKGHIDLCKFLIRDFNANDYEHMLIVATKRGSPDLCMLAKTKADENGKMISTTVLERMYSLAPNKRITELAALWLDSSRLPLGLKYVFTGGFLRSD